MRNYVCHFQRPVISRNIILSWSVGAGFRRLIMEFTFHLVLRVRGGMQIMWRLSWWIRLAWGEDDEEKD